MSDSDIETPSKRDQRRRDDSADDSDSALARDKKRVKLEKQTEATRQKHRRVNDSDQDEDGPVQPRRRRAAAQNDDEDMGSGDEDKDPQDDDDDDDADEPKHVLTRDDDGYVTGSITRIACHSFLTYDSVEFRPGPALNMIIGPNGTGKSTIACAIAIGLGFPAKVLGRATKLSAYCKNDSNEETWIEIELKGHPGEKNLVVRRYLSRDSDKSKFELDGQEVRSQDVVEKMEELQVQVANLCTFLPQDRVAAFAMMSAAERLRETQRAAGHRNLNAWHDVLIKEGKTYKNVQSEFERIAEKLKRIETKQAETEKEVRAFEQREKLEKEKQVIDVLIAFAEYNDTFDKFQQAKQFKTVLTNEIAELEMRYKPFKDSKQALAMIVDACRHEQSRAEKSSGRALKDAEQKKQNLVKADNDRDEINQQLQMLKRDAKEHKEQLARGKEQISKYEALVADEPPEVNTAEIDRQINHKGRQRDDVKQSAREARQEYERIAHRADQVKRSSEEEQRRLVQAQAASGVRDKQCERFDNPTWRVVCWLREHRGNFRGKVYEPARLNVFVKKEWNGRRIDDDQDLISMIEGPIPMVSFSTFLFEYQEDYDLMFKLVHDDAERQQAGSGMRFSGAVVDRNWRLSEMQRSLQPDQLARLGFDAMAIDFLDGPEAVLCWLADTNNLAKIPLQVNRRQLDLPEIDKLRFLQRYYDRDGSYSVKYSNYGNRYAQQDYRALQKAKILNSSVDQGIVEQLQKRIQDNHQHRVQLKEEYDAKKQEEQELLAQAEQLEKEQADLREQKDDMSKSRKQWIRASSKLEQMRKAYEKLKAKPSAAERRAQLNNQLRRIMDKRVRYALEYKDLVMRASDCIEASIKVNLQALQAENDKRAMDLMVQERDEEIEDKKGELKEADARAKELLKHGKELKATAEQLVAMLDPELRARAMTRRDEDLPMNQLQDELADIETNLECMQAVSPAVLEAYNKRKKEIAEMKGKYDDAESRLNESKELIDATEKRWLPKLERLVAEVSEKFSSYFDTLGLLGEVRLAKDDDYEKWGISIWVRFRDPKDKSGDVELHELSGHRQSGGERALTTVTYLLALAELARAPFALVDEINQGMDQRAERNMHKMLVETTCTHDVGQYFLLTPKLLPDLVYHPKMKVLVINVSPWIPGNLSLEKILARKRKLLKGNKA